MFLTLIERQREDSTQTYKQKKFFIPETGEWVTLKVSANALRTINKKGITAVLKEALENDNVLF